MPIHHQKQKVKKPEAIWTKEETKLVAVAASIDLSLEQYVTNKRKVEGISSPRNSPKMANVKDADDATPNPRPDAVTPPEPPSPERTPISRCSSGKGSSKPVSRGEGKEAQVKDAEGTAVTDYAAQSQTLEPTTSSDLIYTYIIFLAYFLPPPPGSLTT